MDKSAGPVTLSGPGWVERVAFQTMRIDEQLSEPFVYELEVVSEEPNLAPADVLGQALTITMEVGNEKRHYNAFAVSFTRLGMSGRFYCYRVALRPWLWFLSRQSNCRIFQNESVPDIVKKVLKKHGFSDFKELLSDTYEPLVYLVQYRETDLHFMRRLLEHAGIYFYFEHTESTHTLILCDSLAFHEPTPLHESLPFLPPDQHRQATMPTIERWEVRHDVATGAIGLTDFDFTRPSLDLGVREQDPGEHEHANYEFFDFPGDYQTTDSGHKFAKARVEELRTRSTHMDGYSSAGGLMVGRLFTMEQHPVEAYNKEYLVTSLRATLSSGQAETGGRSLADGYMSSFTAMYSDQQFRPARVTVKPVVHGSQTAVVAGKKGDEIWTDEYGRIKLRFHWDRFSSNNEESSCWVRVAQIWAGSGFGGIHIPRIGQEVVVDFLEGDPDRPLVTGRVYNQSNMPPYELPANQTQSGIKSRSSKGATPANFNEIRFEDKKGNEDFFMHAEKNQTIKVKENRSASVGAGDSVSVGASRSLSVTADMSVSVGTGGAAKSTLNVTGTHSVDATQTVAVQAPEHILFTCGGSFVKLEPGKITLSAGDGSTVVLDANAFLKSSQGSTTLLDANICSKASGGAKTLLDANVLAQSKANSKIVLDGNANTESLGDVVMQGANVRAQGKMEVGLEAGPSSVKLSSKGTDVAGPVCNVQGTANVGVTAPVVKIG